MGVTSNIEDVAGFLARLGKAVDLSRGLGREVLDGQARRIRDRAAAGQGTAGAFKPNRGEYARLKAEKGLPVGVGLRHDSGPEMLGLAEIKGESAVSAGQAAMTYGTSDASRRKAAFFEADRPFYGLTESDADEILARCGLAADDFLGGR